MGTCPAASRMHSSHVCCKFFNVSCIILSIKSWILCYQHIYATQLPHCSINMTWLNKLKSLFVHWGQNWSFCRYWNNGVDQCVGSRAHVCQWVVMCGKSWEFEEIFAPPFPQCFLAACKLYSGFKNLEVRLLISTNWKTRSARNGRRDY